MSPVSYQTMYIYIYVYIYIYMIYVIYCVCMYVFVMSVYVYMCAVLVCEWVCGRRIHRSGRLMSRCGVCHSSLAELSQGDGKGLQPKSMFALTQ